MLKLSICGWWRGVRGQYWGTVDIDQRKLLYFWYKVKSEVLSMEATLSSKGQATIPKSVREYLNLKAGDRFKFFLQPDGAVVILPVIPVSRLKGSVPKLDRHVSLEEMDAAIAAGAVDSFRDGSGQ
jgi:AbrB family looped-hinge helix DNA binding protein